MSDLTNAQKRKLIRELEKASKLHQNQANLIKRNLQKKSKR